MKIWAKYEHFINKKYEQNTTKKHAKYGENMSKIKVFVLKEVRKFDSLHCRIVAIWLNWLEQLTTRRRCPKSQRIRALYEHFSSNARIIRVRVLNTSDLGTLLMRVFCLCTDAVDASILLMHWSCWYNYVVDALMLMMCWYCWCEYALMQWRCWCSDATDVLMLMMKVCCWCSDSADTLMLLVLMHQWCWSTDAAEALMLLVMMCWSSEVSKKHQKFIFEYWVFSQKYYLNMECFEKVRGDKKYIIIGESHI